MKIAIAKPPIWDDAAKVFDLTKGKVFTYGDTLYNPDGIEIPDHLLKHEETHAEQHDHNETVASLWWQRYLAEPLFRAEQEAEAYGRQYRHICNTVRDRNARFRWLYMFADALSGPLYGKCISHREAVTKIREYSLKK